MEQCRVLLIDGPADITLLKEFIPHISIPVQIKFAKSLKEAFSSDEREFPELIMVGSSIVLQEGFETLPIIPTTPIVILCEADGFNRLLKENAVNVCFLTRPFDITDIPEMLSKAYNFWLNCKRNMI